MIETDEAKGYLKTVFGHEYESYIENHLAGDFACDLVKYLRLDRTDFTLLPRRLTAENGAKNLLWDEFSVEVKHSCSACSFHGSQDECEVCGGEVEWVQSHQVPWTTIKDIYRKIVGHYAPAQAGRKGG